MRGRFCSAYTFLRVRQAHDTGDQADRYAQRGGCSRRRGRTLCCMQVPFCPAYPCLHVPQAHHAGDPADRHPQRGGFHGGAGGPHGAGAGAAGRHPPAAGRGLRGCAPRTRNIRPGLWPFQALPGILEGLACRVSRLMGHQLHAAIFDRMAACVQQGWPQSPAMRCRQGACRGFVEGSV